MLTFAAFSNGKPADRMNLAGAYMVGSDDVPIRADLAFKNGILSCKKRTTGPAGLVLLWPLPDGGTMLMETVRLLERANPYNLSVELARGRMMRISQKLEDWGMLHYDGGDDLLRQVDQARDLLIEALQAAPGAEAAEWGDRALAHAVRVSEALALAHAEAFLARRRQSGGFPRRVLGCSISLGTPPELVQKRIAGVFDFVNVPFVWRDIEPKEQTFNWKPLDTWIETLVKQRIPMHGSTLLSFSEWNVPDWLYTGDHDFDTLHDLAFEHARRVINRYGQYIQTWDAISGIHGNNCFSFNFEQLMELTRMTTALTKQASPRSTVIIDLVSPWGEYYARNHRTIFPLLYADMATQSGVNFDAFGLRMHFGPGIDGCFIRDLFQISSLLDQFAKMGRPLHVTSVLVPSDINVAKDAEHGDRVRLDGGSWRGPWTEDIQAEWVRCFLQIALSKPFVDSVSWSDLADHPRQGVPHSGLLRADGSPKPAYQQFARMRSEVQGSARRGDAALATG